MHYPNTNVSVTTRPDGATETLDQNTNIKTISYADGVIETVYPDTSSMTQFTNGSVKHKDTVGAFVLNAFDNSVVTFTAAG